MDSQKEIEEWVAERRAVLTALVEAEHLDHDEHDHALQQLEMA